MRKAIYDFTDYRKYLNEALPASGESRGSRNRLAEALGCQKGFVSQVLNENAHFSPEHAIKVSDFLEHDSGEEEFFLLLLQLGRSGSQDLSKFWEKKIAEVLEKRKQIKERIQAQNGLQELDQMTYYSSWHFTAIHMCLLVPHLRTRKAISEFLGLPHDAVAKVLQFFIDRGLAEQKGLEFVSGLSRIHLPSDSPLVSKHHANWRMQAIAALDHQKKTDLHYSLIMSLSEKAAEQIKSILLNTIQDLEPTLKAAKDETVYVLNMDLFGLSKVSK